MPDPTSPDLLTSADRPARCENCDRITCPAHAAAVAGIPPKVRTIFQSILDNARPPTRQEREAIAEYYRKAIVDSEDCRDATPDWKARAMAARKYVEDTDADDISLGTILLILDGEAP